MRNDKYRQNNYKPLYDDFLRSDSKSFEFTIRDLFPKKTTGQLKTRKNYETANISKNNYKPLCL
jgi:hypothetical protein